jgi:hypothetical protein
MKEVKGLNKWRDTVLMDGTAHYEDVCTTQSSLQIQCSSYKRFSSLFCRNKKVSTQLHMEFTKDPKWLKLS